MRKKDPALKKQIKEFCEQFYLDNERRSPTTREIADGIGSHFTTVARYLNEMDEEGMIQLDNGIIKTDVTDRFNSPISGISVSGAIPCGEGEDEVEEITDYVAMPSLFLDGGKGSDYFILKTKHDSMRDAGIDDGDFVVLRRTTTARDGDIVAVLLGGRDSTLKRFCVVDGEPFLWAENSDWETERRCIELDEGDRIQGVAVTVVKRTGRNRLGQEELDRIREYRNKR